MSAGQHRRPISWQDTEPVRLYLYSVLVPVVALLVLRGLVSAQESVLWLGVGAAVLGVPAVERVRSLVTSPATVQKLADAHGAAVVQAAREGFDAGQVNALREVAQTITVEPAAVRITAAGAELEGGLAQVQEKLDQLEAQAGEEG